MFRKHRYYGLIGLGLILISFLFWYLPLNKLMLVIANSIFFLGNILFFDFLSYELGGFSLLRSKHGGKFHVLLIGLFLGLFLEFYFNWIGKFWYYPPANFQFYLLILFGFSVYFFYLLETYLGIKALFEHSFLKRDKKINFNGLKTLFISSGLIGAVGIGIFTTLMLTQIYSLDFIQFFSINSETINSNIHWYWYIILISIFFWLILEFLEYERHETSMLLEMIRGNPWPVVAILAAGWISGIIYEGFNVPLALWKYSNIPFSEIKLVGVPLAVILMWPIQYFPFFSMYRLIFRKETEQIWK